LSAETRLVARTEDETRRAARSLAGTLCRDDVVAVSGPLGAGKTVFVRALAEALGADPGQVASPTFAILHEYVDPEGRMVLAHLDLYRLPDRPEELLEIGLPDALGSSAVAVEWPNAALRGLLPPTVEVEIGPRESGEREIMIRRLR
jgi:tRNA threonylcarbamoyladenosine biosynthesis protein TsaE